MDKVRAPACELDWAKNGLRGDCLFAVGERKDGDARLVRADGFVAINDSERDLGRKLGNREVRKVEAIGSRRTKENNLCVLFQKSRVIRAENTREVRGSTDWNFDTLENAEKEEHLEW